MKINLSVRPLRQRDLEGPLVDEWPEFSVKYPGAIPMFHSECHRRLGCKTYLIWDDRSSLFYCTSCGHPLHSYLSFIWQMTPLGQNSSDSSRLP